MRVPRIIFTAAICLTSVAQAELINGISAVVNDSVITYDQVERGIAPLDDLLVRQYHSQPAVLEQKRQELRTRQIEELVERQLILAEFKRAGYNLPESFIDDTVRDEIRKNFYGDRARLTKTLQSEGMTYETFRQQQRDDIIVRELSRMNISPEKILISPFKIEQYYKDNQDKFKVGDQVKLRLIVINQPEGAEPGTAKKIAGEILKKIDNGASFAEMASIYSDSSQRAQGGDRGWIEKDKTDLKKELVDAAFSLKAGRHSKVIEFPQACFLLQVDEVKPAHVRSLAEVRDDIEKTLKDQEAARLHKKWIDRLKSKSYVRYF
jgi:peptidyl-prolyl cis-trans isomerase SurA